MIKDGRLAKKHSDNAQRQSLVLMLINFRLYLASVDLNGVHSNVAPSVKVNRQLFSLKDPFSSEEVGIGHVFHCDGLLLCTTENHRLVVWNPCSGENRWIKPRYRYKEYDIYALGYDKISARYKILRMYSYYETFGTEYEVYDFTSNSWRFVGKSRDWFITQFTSRGVSVEGNAYWLAHSQSGSYHDIFLSTERFQVQTLPHSSAYSCAALSSVVREKKLCLLTTLRDNPLDIEV